MSDRARRLVWYAAYGSNCAPDRFRAYLEGGTAPGARVGHTGARDPRPPRATGPVVFDRQVVFAGESRRWGGGFAFLSHRSVRAGALGRRYLITHEQFDDVLAQENRRAPSAARVDDLTVGEITPTGGGAYAAVLALEPIDGIPVVTFTAPDPPEQREPAPPSAAYIATILRGLTSVHDLSPGAVIDRLLTAPGVAPTWTASTLRRLLDVGKGSVRPMPDPPPVPTLGGGGTGDVRTE